MNAILKLSAAIQIRSDEQYVFSVLLFFVFFKVVLNFESADDDRSVETFSVVFQDMLYKFMR